MGRRCCCPGCSICLDSFGRANSSSILPFIEETGSWGIDTARLKEEGRNGARAYCPIPHPYDASSGVVWVTLKNVQQGDRPVLFINHTPGSTPTEYLKLYFNAAGKVAVELNKGASQTTWSPGGNYTVGGDVQIKICRSNTGIYGGITTQSHPLWICFEPDSNPKPKYAGVANHGTSAIYFDDFEYQQHYLTNDSCQECDCSCHQHCLPYYLKLTVVSDNPKRNGTEIQLEFDMSATSPWQWYGEGTIWDCSDGTGTGTGGTLTDFRLFCQPGLLGAADCTDASHFTLLSVAYGTGCTTHDWTGQHCESYLDCDPLDMRFGPFTCSFSGGFPLPCTDTLIITET